MRDELKPKPEALPHQKRAPLSRPKHVRNDGDDETSPEIKEAIKAVRDGWSHSIDLGWDWSSGVAETRGAYTLRERAFLQELIKVEAIKTLAMVLGGRNKRLALEARVKRLEAAIERKSFNLADAYAGPWHEGETYKRGTLCTYAGSTWIATKNTAARPNDPESGFKLMVKRGRSAKHDRSATE